MMTQKRASPVTLIYAFWMPKTAFYTIYQNFVIKILH